MAAEVKDTIARNAEIIHALHARRQATAKRRTESAEALAAWREACAVFHASYDGLAFPGGLSAALDRLAAGDMVTAETAIIYLEMHPYFFRSQYNTTRLMRALKKFELRPDVQKRFDAVMAAAETRKRARRRNR